MGCVCKEVLEMSGNQGSNAVQKVIPALLEVYTSEVAFRKQLETLKKYLLINPPKVNNKTKVEKNENGLEYFTYNNVKYFKGKKGRVYFEGDSGGLYWTGYSVEDKIALIKTIDDYLAQSVIVFPPNIEEVINSGRVTSIELLKELDEKFASVAFTDSLFKLLDDFKKFLDYVSESDDNGEKLYMSFSILPVQRSMRFVMTFKECVKTFYKQNDIGSLRIALKLRDQGAHVAVKANEVQRIYDIIKYLKKYDMSYAQSGSDMEDSPKSIIFKKELKAPNTIDLKTLEKNIIKSLKAHLQAGIDGKMDLPNLNLLQKINKEYLEHRDKVKQLLSNVNADQGKRIKDGLDLLDEIYKFREKEIKEIEEGFMKASSEVVATKSSTPEGKKRNYRTPFMFVTAPALRNRGYPPKPLASTVATPPNETDIIIEAYKGTSFTKRLVKFFDIKSAMQIIINSPEDSSKIKLEKLESENGDENKYKIFYEKAHIGTVTLSKDGSLSMRIDTTIKHDEIIKEFKGLVETALKVAQDNKHPDMHKKPKSSPSH